MILLTSGETMSRLFDLDWQFIADSCLTMIAILFLFGALSYFLFNPARKMLNGRTEKIKNELEQAASDMDEAKAMKEEYEGKLRDINKEADAIMAEARRKAMLNETQIINEAKEEAARIMERARTEAELEKKKAADDVKKEMIAVASMMAGKVVAGAIDVKLQDDLVDETLREMGEYMAKLIEKVYGEALFSLALEEGRMESLLEEVKAVKQVLTDNPELAKLIQHPGIPENEKEEILQNIWGGRISREVTGLMLLLLKKEHYGQLPLVLDYFIKRVQEEEKIGIAYVKTARPLSEEQKQRIVKRLLETTAYRSFEMHFAVDEALIGGMVIRIGDRVLDNSLRTRLANLSRQLYEVKV